MAQRYILKDLKIPYKGVAYTRENITDEVAKEMLEKHPEYVAFFKSIPTQPVEKPKPAGRPKPKSKGKKPSISE